MKMDHQCNQVLMFRKKLKSRLDPMRYEHSLSVSFTCMNLAMRYGYDIDKAELAGLLHDCGKRFPDSVILKKLPKAWNSRYRRREKGSCSAPRKVRSLAGPA